MYADVRAVRCAGQIRWAREQLEEVATKLCEIGREDLLFQLTNLALELHDLHVDVMKPLTQVPARPPERKLAKQARENLHRARFPLRA
jgi:hypothetical protein